VARVPANRVGMRLSPKRVRPGMSDSTEEKTNDYIIARLNDYGLAYLHISEMIKPEVRISAPP
jgi:2,4-dienoyl-CoA reductase-like NADH-dependent reductase (Old Yellow Enzyme family)